MWFIKCIFCNAFNYVTCSICHGPYARCSMICDNIFDSNEVNPSLVVFIVKIKGLWVEMKANKFMVYWSNWGHISYRDATLWGIIKYQRQV